MGANISALGRSIRTRVRSLWNTLDDFSYLDDEQLEGIHLPSLRRPLLLRNGGPLTLGSTTKWSSYEIICCERDTECKLYISVFDERNRKIIYATIYQDTASSSNSLFEVFWINPRTGNSDAVTFTYPVEATAIRDLFI